MCPADRPGVQGNSGTSHLMSMNGWFLHDAIAASVTATKINPDTVCGQ